MSYGVGDSKKTIRAHPARIDRTPMRSKVRIDQLLLTFSGEEKQYIPTKVEPYCTVTRQLISSCISNDAHAS